MLTLQPSRRPKAAEALDHDWFKIMNKDTSKKDAKSLKSTLNDLQSFKIKQKMQQAALTYMANHLVSESELKTLNNVFKQLDVDNNGKLSKQELLEGYKDIDGKMSIADLEKLFEAADADNSGEIDYSEWVLAAANKNKLLSDENLECAFKMFDQDGSGAISSDELKAVLGGNKSKIGAKYWEDMIAEVDDNGGRHPIHTLIIFNS
jgi:calcium-dependent protein kinase